MRLNMYNNSIGGEDTMSVEETLATNEVATDATTEATDTNQATAQAEPTVKTYTQREVDDMMARLKGSITHKVQKQYEDLGDVDELRNLKAEAEKRQQEEQIKRGEFEKTLQELAAKKDAEIQKRDVVITEYKVNTPLLNAAAKYRSVNPEQVRSLLSRNVRLNDSNEVEVLGDDGAVKYTDAGTPLTVDDYVKSWLADNPHFVQATPSTTNTKSNFVSKNEKLDITKLDMQNKEHRDLYREYRKANGLS